MLGTDVELLLLCAVAWLHWSRNVYGTHTHTNWFHISSAAPFASDSVCDCVFGCWCKALQKLYSALTVPLQCPYSALTVPIRKNRSALIFKIKKDRVQQLLFSFTLIIRALCVFLMGTVRAL